jgi:hypothetical protein
MREHPGILGGVDVGLGRRVPQLHPVAHALDGEIRLGRVLHHHDERRALGLDPGGADQRAGGGLGALQVAPDVVDDGVGGLAGDDALAGDHLLLVLRSLARRLGRREAGVGALLGCLHDGGCLVLGRLRVHHGGLHRRCLLHLGDARVVLQHRLLGVRGLDLRVDREAGADDDGGGGHDGGGCGGGAVPRGLARRKAERVKGLLPEAVLPRPAAMTGQPGAAMWWARSITAGSSS